MWQDKYIAVDWGTTNRRAWLMSSDGAVMDAFEDDMGIMSVPCDGFERAASEIRSRLGDHEMLLAGMVGSDKGWRQVPYRPCPVDLQELAENLFWIDARTGIVPGVCQSDGHADVMRGEEVQALGALAAGWISPGSHICHPGTHAKWIRMEEGRIASFQTMMTGELFSLLREHSILSAQLEGAVAADASFEAGVEEARAGIPLLSALFSIRARYLLGQGPSSSASFASGLLIGDDVHAGLAAAHPNEKIAVIGRSDLCQLYAVAIQSAGFESFLLDGKECFQAGIRALVKQIQAG